MCERSSLAPNLGAAAGDGSMNWIMVNSPPLDFDPETTAVPMDKQAAEAIKADFLEWSGGFPPESEEQVFIYVQYAAPSDVDEEELLALLRTWMQE